MSSPPGYLAPLPMSQTKDELVTYLNMVPETYALMAKEVDHVYKWLTSDKHHLKKNCKRKPPYDWSDILEKSKDDAIAAIARNGSEHTSYYWNLAQPAQDCSNWIAKWFLYHKFRYRDGRNRNAGKDEGSHSHSSSSKHSHHRHTGDGERAHGRSDGQQDSSNYSGSYSGSTGYGQDTQQGYGYTSAGPSTATTSYASYSYDTTTQTGASRSQTNDSYSYTSQPEASSSGQLPYDPVRDS